MAAIRDLLRGLEGFVLLNDELRVSLLRRGFGSTSSTGKLRKLKAFTEITLAGEEEKVVSVCEEEYLRDIPKYRLGVPQPNGLRWDLVSSSMGTPKKD